MKLSNDVEKYEIEVTKMGQNYSLFLTVYWTIIVHPLHYCIKVQRMV